MMAETKTEDDSSCSSVIKTCIAVFVAFTILHVFTTAYLLVEVLNIRGECQLNREHSLIQSETTSQEDSSTSAEGHSNLSTQNDIDNHNGSFQDVLREKRQVSCGFTRHVPRNSQSTFTVQTPNYPGGNYPRNRRCEWNFVLDLPQPRGYGGSHILADTSLRISFPTPINIEERVRCTADRIEIRGGSSTGPLLQTYCGLDKRVASVSFSGSLHILFISDSRVTARGFTAQVSIAPSSEPVSAPQLECGGSNSQVGAPGNNPRGSGAPSPGRPPFTRVPGGVPFNQSPGRDRPPGARINSNVGARRDIGPPGRDGARGPPGGPTSKGNSSPAGPSGAVGQPGPRQKGEPGAKGQPGPSDSREDSDVTFVRWGRRSCRNAQTFYEGYAVGFANSGPVKCVPMPVELKSTDQSVTNVPALLAAKFHLRGVTGALNTCLENRVVRCAFCHAERNEVFTVIGWKSCNTNHNWVTEYSGYLMTVWSPTDSSSETICMDSNPENIAGYGLDSQAPKLTYVRSGAGLWIEDKIIPCAVCIKVQTRR